MAARNRKHDGAIFRKRSKPAPITDPQAIAAELSRFVETYNKLPAGPTDQVQAWAAEIDRLGEAIAAEPPDSVVRDDIETLRQSLVEIAGYFRDGNPKALAHAMRACALYGYRLAILRCRVQGIEHAAAAGLNRRKGGQSQADVNRASAFNIGRDELLVMLRKSWRMYRCSRKELAEHVAESLPIGPDSVLNRMKKYRIFKADYATEK